jgi:N-acetyl-gamma-glutamyl-phosphate reductase common form
METSSMINCAILGGSGYIGGELIRLALQHPNINLVAVTANEMAGLPIAKVHPNLSHSQLVFNELYDINQAEVLFLALPHGKAMQCIEQFADKRIIDTSADFRLTNQLEFEKFYKTPHCAFEKAKSFCYGLPELFRASLKNTQKIAAPGCFATAAILATFPLIAEGLATDIIINAVTGSSGSGIKAIDKTHHAFRSESFFAYELFTHRHIPEIRQALKDKTGHEIALIFQPHSGPFIRGIYITTYIKLQRDMTKTKLLAIYKEYYTAEPFIRLVEDVPNIKWVQNTNFCDLNVATNGRTVIVTAAIDNLLKGGAAQAIQCFNIMHGLDESTGLQLCRSNP